MKAEQAHRVFQVPERCLHAPAHGVEFLERRQRELIRREIRQKDLIGSFRQFETDNSEGQVVKVIGFWVKEVKADRFRDKSVQISFLQKGNGDLVLLAYQVQVHLHVEFVRSRQVET